MRTVLDVDAVEVVPPGNAPLDRIRQAVATARASLAALFESAGVDATKARETARVLNINRGLVWRVSRVIGAEDDVTAATHMPGQVGLERMLEACRARGVDETTLEATRAAVQGFHAVAERLSGDRRTLEILLANAGSQTTSLDLEGARRSLFEGGCAVWGVRAETRLRNMFLFPNPSDPSRVDEAGVAGYAGFRRLRRVPWPMTYKAVYSDTGAADAPREEPIDPEGAVAGGLPLLREFCVPRDLKIQAVHTARGAVRHELPAGADAVSEATTCLFGSVYRSIYTTVQTPECRVAGSLLVMDTPVERVILDTFVHRSLGITAPPQVMVLDRLTRPHGYNAEDLHHEMLPIEAPVRRLGPGAAGSVTPHLPWYPRLVETICRRIGLPADEFVAHRIELVYPPIPTALVAQFTLPAPAGV